MKKNKKIFLTIDVEVDKSDSWKISEDFSFLSINALVDRRFCELVDKYNIKPIFFISPEVMDDVESVKILNNLPYDAELAAHLHTQFIKFPPEIYKTLAGKYANEAQSDLSYEDEEQLINKLTFKFINKFNKAPLSFRPGRYSLNAYSYKFLINNGYKICSAVTPYIYWKYDKSYVDYTKFNNNYKIFIHNNIEIIEYPISIHKGFLSFGDYSSLLSRINNKIGLFFPRIFGKNWLRPSFGNFRVYKTFFESSYDNLVVIFHSNELVIGGSPYSKNSHELDLIYDRLDTICSIAIENGYVFDKFNI